MIASPHVEGLAMVLETFLVGRAATTIELSTRLYSRGLFDGVTHKGERLWSDESCLVASFAELVLTGERDDVSL